MPKGVYVRTSPIMEQIINYPDIQNLYHTMLISNLAALVGVKPSAIKNVAHHQRWLKKDKPYRTWSRADIKYLADNMGKVSISDMAAHLDAPVSTVRAYTEILGRKLQLDRVDGERWVSPQGVWKIKLNGKTYRLPKGLWIQAHGSVPEGKSIICEAVDMATATVADCYIAGTRGRKGLTKDIRRVYRQRHMMKSTGKTMADMIMEGRRPIETPAGTYWE